MKSKSKKGRPVLFKRKYLCIPYALFLVLFVIAPILIIVYYAFTDKNGNLSADALLSFFTNWSKVNTLIVSVFIALQTTIICLIIGYPLAFFLANKKFNKKFRRLS